MKRHLCIDNENRQEMNKIIELVKKKNKKFVDFLLRKGYETGLIYEKLKELEVGS